MFVSAIDARSTEPLPCTTAATATVAQSWARRFIFVYDQPAEPSFGTRISTSISSGSSAVWKTPGEELAGRDRPLAARGPARRARRRARGSPSAGRRRDRRARASRRSCRDDGPAGRRPGRPCARRSDSAPGGRAPWRRPCAASARRSRSCLRPPGRTTDRRCGRRRSRSAGRAMRSFIAGMSECPPASSFASSRFAEELDRVIGMLGDDVVERRRDHRATSSIAVQTRSGVAGSWTSVTPRCESASTTALMTAGAAAIVPVSPTPFTPSGLSAAVSVRSVS